MTKEEITTLSEMARIAVGEAEVETLRVECDAILEYVGEIDQVVTENALKKQVGPVHNVFRTDEAVSATPEQVESLLNEMPVRHGRFLQVKKILQTDD